MRRATGKSQKRARAATTGDTPRTAKQLVRAAVSRSEAFDPTRQDHLFISYAWENCALAEWLVRRLTSHGYRVWCDRFQMLGGESFPTVIDEAIKTRTFRLIALLSRHSLHKPNPRKERTLALSLGREWGVDFMIPLNVDGLKPSELPWDYSDVTYVPFQDWQAGLDQLLRALTKAGVPRPLTVEEGRQIAAETFLPQHIVQRRKEILYTNCFAFERLPSRLYLTAWNGDGARPDLEGLTTIWPYYTIEGNRCISFSPPPSEVPSASYQSVKDICWRDEDVIEGIRSRDVVSNLLWQSTARTLVRRGLKRDPETGLIYFPRGLLTKNKIKYWGGRGRKTWVAVVGEKRLRGKPYRYHLAPDFQIRQDLGLDYIVQMKVRVRITDNKGKRFDHAGMVARRKHVASSWFNHHWLSRVLGIASFLAKGKPKIVLLQKSDPVILFATPVSGEVAVAINEGRLKGLRQELAASPTGWEEEDSQEIED